MRSSAVLILVLAGLASCTKNRVRPGAPSVPVGQCANPDRDGVMGKTPKVRRADRDLNGDGDSERVVADANLCAEGNCHWNLFARGAGGCWRYLGTVAAQRLEPQTERAEDGFRDIQGWWSFGEGGRYLLTRHQYRHGGYRVVEALVCRELEDDRVRCAPDRR